MCSFVILAGNWVLLICVWGCRFCSNIAHMHIKLLYELNTCLRRRSSSSSLACCLKKTTTDSLNNWNGHTACPLPSPSPITPSRPCSDLVTDGADKMRLSALWNLQGETCWWGYYTFHTPQRLLSIKCDPSTPHFFLMFYQLRLFFSVSSFDWPYLPLFPSPSLFNNNLISSFILLVMISSSIIALCSFPISDISDGFLSSFFIFSFPFSLLSSLCSLVSQCSYWFRLLFVSVCGGATHCHCMFGVRVTH